MKILLTAINAKYIHSNLAVYSLYSYAKEYREYIELAEYTINHREDYILEGIYKSCPDVLMFSCYIWNISYVEEIAEEFHKIRPDVPIWVGGPEVSYETEEFINNHEWCSGIIVGEGEQTFKELCGYYIAGSDKLALNDISGLAFLSDGNIYYTKPRDLLCLDEIPFCYENISDFENRIIYYESSRGCPFSCSYCLSSIDKKLRFRSLNLVKDELRIFIEEKVPQVKFVDRTFNCDHEHAMAIWEFILENDNGITNFHFEISADLIRDDELELLAKMRPGLVQLEIGVQSTNPETITEIHRTMNLDRLKRVVGVIGKNENIHEHLDLIAGLPDEDYPTFQKSFNEIYALKPNQLQLGFLKVLKGSYMYEHASEYGIVYHSGPPYEVMKTRWLSYDELLNIKSVEEMLEVYYNSGQFPVSISVLECFFASAFDMFLRLGKFYEQKGYYEMKHSRLKRAQIVLEFVREELGISEIGLFEEALTYDLYLRENCNTRPSWAPDVSSFKAITKKYCPNGKTSHVEPFHYMFFNGHARTQNKQPLRTEKTVWVLFEYNKRSPLDNQAYVTEISPDV